jgi:hypothetical protein
VVAARPMIPTNAIIYPMSFTFSFSFFY